MKAAPITFFGQDLNGDPFSRIAFPKAAIARASFLSQLSASATDTLEEFSTGSVLPLTLTFGGQASATLNVSSGTAIIRTFATGTNGFGLFPTSGTNFLETNAASLSISFVTPITSFGFYGTDIGDFGGQLSLLFTRPGGSTATVVVPHSIGTGRGSSADGSVLFFGYIDTANPFSSVQLLDSAASDSFGFDDPVIGVTPAATVPEPISLTLCTAGLLAIVVRRKQYC